MNKFILALTLFLTFSAPSFGSILLVVSSDDQKRECVIDEDHTVTVTRYSLKDASKEGEENTYEVTETTQDKISEKNMRKIETILEDSKDGALKTLKGILYPPMVSIIGHPVESKAFSLTGSLTRHYEGGEVLRGIHPGIAGGYPEYNVKTDFKELKKVVQSVCGMSRLGESSILAKVRKFIFKF